MRILRWGLNVSCLAILLAMSGCSMYAPEQRYVLRATGRGDASVQPPPPLLADPESEAPARDLAEWADGVIEMRGESVRNPEATSRVEGLVLARREAVEQALREVARRVESLAAPGGYGTIGRWLAENPAQRQQVEHWIFSSPVDVAVEGPLDRTSAVARFDLMPLAELFALAETEREETARQAELAQEGADSSEPDEQTRAYEAALTVARERLQAQVEQLFLAPGYRVRDFGDAVPEAARRTRLAVENARVESVRYLDRGVCEVDLALDADLLVRDLRGMMW